MPVGHRHPSQRYCSPPPWERWRVLKEKASPWTELWSPRRHKKSFCLGWKEALSTVKLHLWGRPLKTGESLATFSGQTVTQICDFPTSFTMFIGLGHLVHCPEPLLYNMWYYHFRELARSLTTSYISPSAFTVIKTFPKIIADLKFTVYLSMAWSICVY